MKISALEFSDEASERMNRDLAGDKHGPDTARRVIRNKLIVEGLGLAVVCRDGAEALYKREIGWTENRVFLVLFSMSGETAHVKSVLTLTADF